jgi:GntR family transcriptional regulator
VLSHQSGVPIYEQIKEQIKASVLSGELPENELLPSIRQLARDLKVSVITTTRAYNDLEIEGFVQTVPGKGCYIKKIDNDLLQMKYLSETKATLIVAIRQGKMAGLTMAELHKLLDDLEDA